MTRSPSANTTRAGHEAGAAVWGWLGLAAWLVPMLVVTVLVWRRPEARTVTPLYHEAAAHWRLREPLYTGPTGMNYLPPFALLFSPFAALPSPWGDILWRWASAAMIAGGLWRWRRAWPGVDPSAIFLVGTLLTLPLVLPALRNGQANATLAGLLLLATGSLREGRWSQAGLFLALTVAVKPLGVAAVGLAAAAFPASVPAVAIGLAVVCALPFLTAPAGYAGNQFAACLDNLRRCAAISEHRFADLNGLLRTLGTEITGTPALLVRAGAGALLFAACWFQVRREPEPSRSLAWYALAAGYLMLFNPMNEANSYAILAPAMTLCAFQCLLASRAAGLACGVAAMTLTMGLLPNLMRPWLGNQFALFWHPLMTLLFLGAVLRLVVRPRTPPHERNAV